MACGRMASIMALASSSTKMETPTRGNFIKGSFMATENLLAMTACSMWEHTKRDLKMETECRLGAMVKYIKETGKMTNLMARAFFLSLADMVKTNSKVNL